MSFRLCGCRRHFFAAASSSDHRLDKKQVRCKTSVSSLFRRSCCFAAPNHRGCRYAFPEFEMMLLRPFLAQSSGGQIHTRLREFDSCAYAAVPCRPLTPLDRVMASSSTSPWTPPPSSCPSVLSPIPTHTLRAVQQDDQRRDFGAGVALHSRQVSFLLPSDPTRVPEHAAATPALKRSRTSSSLQSSPSLHFEPLGRAEMAEDDILMDGEAAAQGVKRPAEETVQEQGQAPDIEAIINRAIREQTRVTNDFWDKKIDTVMDSQQKVLREQGELFDKKLDNALTTMRSEMGDLRSDLERQIHRISQQSEVGSLHSGRGADSEASTAATRRLGPISNHGGDAYPRQPNFVPTRIDIKGFCAFDERDSKGLTRAEVTSYIERLRREVGDGWGAKVDMDATMAMNSRVMHGMIAIKVNTDALGKSQCYVLRKLIVDAFAKNPTDLEINSVIPRVVIEVPPWKKPMMAAGGKALSVFEKFGFKNLKADWNPPVKIYSVPPGNEDRPVLLGIFDDSKWRLKEGNMRALVPTIDTGAVATGLIA